MAPFVLALDIGTSSVRSLIFDERGDPVLGSEAQRLVALTTTAGGGVEIDPLELSELAFACLDETVSVGKEPIAAVGISCFWHSLMGVDEYGAPTTPVLMYSDTRSADEAAELRAELDADAVHDRTGCVPHSSYWPAKLRWLQRVHPIAVSRTARWLAFSGYLLRLTHGFDATSVSMASATGMMDIRAVSWDRAMIDASGVRPSSMPDIVAQAALDHPLRPEFAARWPGLAAARWFPGLGDGACANVGTGAVTASRIALTVGTTGALRVLVDAPPRAALAIPRDLWAYRLDERSALLGAAISNGGKLMAWLSELTGTPLDGYAMEAAAEQAPDGHGLTLLPFLAGERSPLWSDRVTGVIAGLTLHTDKADLLRAGVESVAYRLARLYRSVGAVAAQPHEIIANGAAILRSPVWLEIITDAIGHPIRTLPEMAEASARGAALMALRGIGAIADLSDASDPAAGGPIVIPNLVNTHIYAAAIARQHRLETLLYPDQSLWSD